MIKNIKMDEFIDCLKCDDVMDLTDIIEDEEGNVYLRFKCFKCDSSALIKS